MERGAKVKRLALSFGLALLRPIPGVGQAGAPAGPQLDGDLVSAIHAANDAEIIGANAALASAVSENVKTFARKMTAEHAESDQKIDRWLTAEGGVSAAPGPLTGEVRAEAERDQAALAGLRGAAFDRAYVDEQVRWHSSVLELVQNEGGRASPSMTGLLEDARNMLSDHLQQARQLQARL